MPKNKESKSSVIFLKKFLVFAFIVFLLGLGCKMTAEYLKRSPYFRVKEVLYHPSLRFMAPRETPRFKGKNLLALDVEKTQQQLQSRYPQIMNLRVVKRFPGQLCIIAKQRLPYALFKVNGQNVVLDEEGIILSSNNAVNYQLPLIEGISYHEKIAAGHPIQGRQIKAAYQVIEAFQNEERLSSYRILKIDIRNLSKISFYITEDLQVFVDREDIPRKLELLSYVLSQARQDLPNTKYIDLRFKEPIVGRK